MSKLDLSTIIIVALCIFALGFLIWKTVGLNKDKNTSENTTQIVTPTDDPNEDYEFDDEGEIISDASTQSGVGGSSSSSTVGSATGVDSNNGSTTTNSGADNTSGSIASSGNSGNNSSIDAGNSSSSSVNGGAAGGTSSTSRPTFYDDDSRGQYLVLAGAFRIKDNGINEARRIRRMGYNDAEMTLMDRGTYATVLVDRFTSMSEAKALVSDLRAKGVESYVHRKR